MRVLFAVLLGFVATQLHAQGNLSPEYPPLGRLIDVGGRKLHLYCTGSGSPTIILMAGGGAFSIDWALVQPKIAESTRICSYDRAGLGWSDPGPADETVEQTITDLHALLRAERGPFVLVGASIGGIYVRAYQRRFPDGTSVARRRPGRLDFLSSNSLHITASGSGHEIHVFQPNVVVEALVRAISAIRNAGSLSRPSLRSTASRPRR